MPLGAQRAQPLVAQPADLDIPKRPRGNRADDRLGANLLAVVELDAYARAAVHADPPHDRTEPDPRAEPGRHLLRDGRRPFRNAQTLPALEVVEAVAADRRVLAELREQRGPVRGIA